MYGWHISVTQGFDTHFDTSVIYHVSQVIFQEREQKTS